MALAMVGLATGLGARYPRFNAENPSQVAGSYGGVAFMILAVLFMILLIALVGWPSSVFLWHRAAHIPLPALTQAAMAACVGDRPGDEPRHLVARHALGREGARGDGRLRHDALSGG